MKKRTILILGILSLIILIFIGYFYINKKSCDYTNFAWGAVHKECSCLGLEIDDTCRMLDGSPCPDAGGGTACIGIVTERRCYNYSGIGADQIAQWSQVPCAISSH